MKPSREDVVLYILNALPGGAISGHRGVFRPASADEALAVLRAGGWTSAVGHESTAQALSAWAGVTVPFARVTVTLAKGDVLLVAALRGPRLAEGQVLTREEVEGRGFDFLLVEITE